jgi:dipeptidyl aminopeptidase/acylaminoacyl peptidase
MLRGCKGLGVVVGLALTATLVVGCGSNRSGAPSGPRLADQPITLPPLGPARQVAAGVQLHEATVGAGNLAGKVWVYLPQPAPQGKLPCMLIAPAGTPLIHGMDLAEGDQDEHLPYVRAGFAVVAYAIAGPVQGDFNENNAQHLQAVRAFVDADGGVVNAKWALDFALDKVPQIDPERIYTAGHSSAGTLSLQVAEAEPRIKGCIAFAPVTDLAGRLEGGVPLLDRKSPGFAAFVEKFSPITHADRLRCPLFLFHAQDDNVVPVSESVRLAEAVKRTNPQVQLVQVPRGGHHSPMIQKGIPQAIQWLKKLPS